MVYALIKEDGYVFYKIYGDENESVSESIRLDSLKYMKCLDEQAEHMRQAGILNDVIFQEPFSENFWNMTPEYEIWLNNKKFDYKI